MMIKYNSSYAHNNIIFYEHQIIIADDNSRHTKLFVTKSHSFLCLGTFDDERYWLRGSDDKVKDKEGDEGNVYNNISTTKGCVCVLGFSSSGHEWYFIGDATYCNTILNVWLPFSDTLTNSSWRHIGVHSTVD